MGLVCARFDMYGNVVYELADGEPGQEGHRRCFAGVAMTDEQKALYDALDRSRYLSA